MKNVFIYFFDKYENEILNFFELEKNLNVYFNDKYKYSNMFVYDTNSKEYIITYFIFLNKFFSNKNIIQKYEKLLSYINVENHSIFIRNILHYSLSPICNLQLFNKIYEHYPYIIKEYLNSLCHEDDGYFVVSEEMILNLYHKKLLCNSYIIEFIFRKSNISENKLEYMKDLFENDYI